jgi:hypothetical protein
VGSVPVLYPFVVGYCAGKIVIEERFHSAQGKCRKTIKVITMRMGRGLRLSAEAIPASSLIAGL